MAQDQQNDPSVSDSAGAASVLHRKAASGRAAHQSRAMTLARALRLSIVKVADDVLGMAMAVLSLRAQKMSEAKLGQIMDNAGLLMLFDGHAGRRAAVILDTACVTALIQQQTMGDVRAIDEDSAREMTDTDAALCAPFIEAVIARAAELPEREEERKMVSGFQFGARAEDARVLQFSLDATEYEVIQVDLDIERGNKQGKLILCFPVLGAGQHDAELEVARAAESDALADPKMSSLANIVPALSVELRIVLSRLTLPLSKASKLRVGDTLSLSTADFGAVEIQTAQGGKLGFGALGQLEGRRAIKVAHRAAPKVIPQRRATDRPGLRQPDIDLTEPPTAHSSEDQILPIANTSELSEVAEYSDSGAALPIADLPELPDMSDIPDFDEFELPDAAQG